MRYYFNPLFCLWLCLLIVLTCSNALFAATTSSATHGNRSTRLIMLSVDVDFNYEHFAASRQHTNNNAAQTVVLWFTPGYANPQRHYEFAADLAKQGVEVWVIDLLENLFMPHGVNSIRQLSGDYVRDFIIRAQQITHKNVVIVSGSYGAIPLLRGAYLWQQSKPKKPYLLGAVLFSPSLYREIPPLGELPRYVPITRHTSIPIMLYQSEKHSSRRQLAGMLRLLQQGGAKIHTKILKGSTAIFYSEDHAVQTIQTLRALPKELRQSFRLLASSPARQREDLPKLATQHTASSLNSALMPYTANRTPPSIHLKDIFAKAYDRDQYHGKVTLVNFWASWCKPCLEEIPSLNRLQAHFPDSQKFEILSINYAQSPTVIKDFMKKVRIEFPVLIDESGEQAARWKVLAFPSTFVIGRDGKIHYGVNAGIMWDTAEVIKILQQLQKQ